MYVVFTQLKKKNKYSKILDNTCFMILKIFCENWVSAIFNVLPKFLKTSKDSRYPSTEQFLN